jgi:hypothetical protein
MDRGQIASGETIARVMALSSHLSLAKMPSGANAFKISFIGSKTEEVQSQAE